MKRKNFRNDQEMKKLLNKLSTEEAKSVKGGSQADDIKGISVGITINF